MTSHAPPFPTVNPDADPGRPMYNTAAEQAVLSAILLDDTSLALRTTRHLITPEAFHTAAHRVLYRAMMALADTEQVIDPLTLTAELERTGELERAGGRDHLAYLVDVVPTAANVEYHARILRRHAHRRALIDAVERARVAVTTEAADPDEIARHLQAETLGVAVDDDQAGFRAVTPADITTLAEAVEARAHHVAAGHYPGLPTGFHAIDKHTQGFRPGELVIIGAVPKAWKTAFVDNVALNLLHAGYVGGKVSAEMTREETLERMIATEAGISGSTLARGQLVENEWIRFGTAGALLSRGFHIDDEAFPELGDVIARCTELKARIPALAFLVVDYLQLVSIRLKGRRGDEELNEVCRALKGIAKRLNVVMLAPAQCNYKEIDGREDKHPQLKDFQGASGMAQTANFALLLYNPLLYDPMAQPILDVNVAASRRTPTFLAKLAMQPDTQRLRDLDPPRLWSTTT